jgi:2-polyprenyl-3-methyl-5-hydroxy-6-metoxy-1,4-benzoquinol methylase
VEHGTLTGQGGVRIQVSPDHYDRSTYITPDREQSFGIQERLVTRWGSVLEIGIGPGVLRDRVRAKGIRLVTADIDRRLGPNVAASVTALPFRNASFEAVAAFEVLEHIPLPSLGEAVSELCRVASRRVIVSIPEKRDRLRTFVSIRILRRTWADPQHHWELGLFVSKGRFLRLFAAHGFRLLGYDASHPWHRFFVFGAEGLSPSRARFRVFRGSWHEPDFR